MFVSPPTSMWPWNGFKKERHVNVSSWVRAALRAALKNELTIGAMVPDSDPETAATPGPALLADPGVADPEHTKGTGAHSGRGTPALFRLTWWARSSRSRLRRTEPGPRRCSKKSSAPRLTPWSVTPENLPQRSWRTREGPIPMGRATNRSVRFTGGNVSRQGFWRNWGVWGDRSPRSLDGGSPAGESARRSGISLDYSHSGNILVTGSEL